MMFLNDLLKLYLSGSWCDIYITLMDEDGNYKYEFVDGVHDVINMNPIQYCQAMDERELAISKYDNMLIKMFFITKEGALDVTLLTEGLV